MTHPASDTTLVSGDLQSVRAERIRLRSQAWLSTWLTCYVLLWLFDGVLRKWVLSGLSDQLYFGKDAVTFIAFGAVLMAGVDRREANRLQVGLGVLLVLVLFASAQFIATSQPPLSLVVGVVTYGAPVLALAMVTCVADRGRHLRRIQTCILVCLPVQALLTAIQTQSPATGFWNRIGDGGVVLVTSDNVVRATGTFMAPSGLTAFSVLAVAIVLSRVIGPGYKLSVADALYLVSGVVVVSLGGSRGAVLGSVIVAAGAVVWALAARGFTFTRLLRLGLAIVVVFVLVDLAGRLFPRVTSAFARRFDEASTKESSTTRVSDNAFGYWDLLGQVSWLGDGLGSHTLSGIAAGSELGWYEIELSRWVAELGVAGVLLCVARQALALALVVASISSARRSSSPLVVLVALALAPALLYGAVSAPAAQAGFAVTATAILFFAWPRRATDAESATRSSVHRS